MKRLAPRVVSAILLLASAPAWAAEEAEAPQKFLGLPVDLWKLANLLLILGLLVYFLGKPFNTHFRKRREDLDDAIDRAAAERDRALALAAEMTARLAALEKEIAEIRARGAQDGENEKRAQLEAAAREAELLRRNAADEIERRLAAAKTDLARAAADLAADRARDVLAGAVTEEDRRRLFDESVRNVAVEATRNAASRS
ncbi:MAG TPA: ATP synthase F0 subunit B [Thermoanaerobaculia bacterium]|nr:ATP synthase F0 subunit B [Thermoanaerobaculia bacterium]